MDPTSVLAYVAALALLFGKYFAVTLLQAKRRFSTRVFRWPEDARAWRGQPSAREDELLERAQAVLRNDAETQPFFFAFGAVWVALGAPAAFAQLVLPGYALARCVHTWLLLYPRQPARNRAFVVAQLLLFAVIGDCLRRAINAL
ncbi:MAG: hypothetical protein JWN48_1690 [Myxococcaceae bacterium]|nr:hypothetical protein [Myxococcaceae bacterium]